MTQQWREEDMLLDVSCNLHQSD